ncbi:aminopeptidase P family protein [Crassaminicella thermophila]|uniref:Aminopeptidase P family protein n=1 Tax=Crassaminicella thermophila TaxID=2599308 RepID=A0A5C0SEH0_CRATE|nr:Xaa-Pro peptidase family protein [Crassaminicella thermophila]QEK12137.1 aminopeptidase P family protein [Crassaminicella thermophila]
MLRRLSKLREILKKKNLDAAIIYKPENRRYISQFTGTSGYALITVDRAFLITDFRYIEQSRKECKEYEIIEHSNNYSIYSILNELSINRLGFEDDFVTYMQYKEFSEKLNNIELVPLDGAINILRKIKYEEEINNIEKAAIIADEAFGYICEYIKPGISEKDIALELENYMKRKGATATSFTTIVASGVRSSLPHGVASDKLVEKGDFITIDFGCIYNGYCSDMTRTIVLGKANDKQKEIYNIVLEAQLRALDAIKPGITGMDADKIARDFIKSKGYGENFGHGLGHGVGLEIHEDPRLSPTGKDTLQSGMVVTDEPGIYIPDFGGVRIEDLVVITKTGNRVLSKSPKQLLEL